MKHLSLYITALAALCLTSCISEDVVICPPLHIMLGVKDKNYSNVDQVPWETPVAENLPFHSYVGSIYYTLRRADTGEVVEEQPLMTTDEGKNALQIGFCECIPYGKYVFTAYGNMKHESEVDSNGWLLLHENDTEGEDNYLCCDTIDYDLEHNGHYLEMERAKDKLIVVTEGIPEDMQMTLRATHVADQADPFHKNTDTRFTYYGTTGVEKTFDHTEQVAKMLLAPSEAGRTSTLHATFTKKGQPASPDDVAIDMDRNALTVVKYVYSEDEGFTVFILVNGSWEAVSGLVVE